MCDYSLHNVRDFLPIHTLNEPISSSSFSIGIARSVRTPPSSTAATTPESLRSM
jgi:hypothetical protein